MGASAAGWAGFQFAVFEFVEDVAALHALLEREDRMVGGHGVHEQQLLQYVLVEEPGKVAVAPAFQRAEQLVDAGVVAGSDQGQKEGHLAAVLPVRRLAGLAGRNVRDELLGVVDAQLDAAQLLGVTPAELLQARPQKAQLEWKAHVEQGAHRIYPVVAL